jgi:hypothetical protein
MDTLTKVRQATDKLEAEILDEYGRMVELLDCVCFDSHTEKQLMY